MICPGCGYYIEGTPDVCNVCGRRFEKKNSDNGESHKKIQPVCSECGYELAGYESVCPVCGTPTTPSETAPCVDKVEHEPVSTEKKDEEKTVPEKEKRKIVFPIGIQKDKKKRPTPTNIHKAGKKEKHKKSVFPIGITAVVSVFFLVGLTIWLLVNGGASQDELLSSQPKEESSNFLDSSISAVATHNSPSAIPAPVKDFPLSTDYYSLTMPGTWKGNYREVIEKTEEGAYGLFLYHLKTQEESSGETEGFLFAIDLIPETAELPSYAHIRYLGDLKVPGTGTFYVYAYLPVDTQYIDVTEKEYLQMSQNLDSILNSFSPAQNFVFTPTDGTVPTPVPKVTVTPEPVTLEPYTPEPVISEPTTPKPAIRNDLFEPYILKIHNPFLPIYDSPDFNANIVGEITDNGSYTIVEEYWDSFSSSTWGRLKSGVGWINIEQASMGG